MVEWLAPLLSAGASLLGNLVGGKQEQKPTTTTSYVDYARMVKDAEAAGFNPLTAIRNGGSAGFSATTTSGGGVTTPLSSRLASGLADASQSFLANFDPVKDQKQELEARLVEAQIANLNASSNRLMYPDAPARGRDLFGGVPSYTAPPVARQVGQGVGHGQTVRSASEALGSPATPDAGKVTVTNPWQSASVDPTLRDASAFEERYGDSEVASTIIAMRNGWGDYAYNASQPGATGLGPVLLAAGRKLSELDDDWLAPRGGRQEQGRRMRESALGWLGYPVLASGLRGRF